MINCQFTISIKEMIPIEKIKISINNFSFHIKSDTKEGEIKLQDKNTSTFVSNISSIMKDARFSIRLINRENDIQSLIGLADLLVPFIQIRQYKTNQTFTYEKKLILSMIDSTKRLLFGSLLNAPNICITVETIVKIINAPKKSKPIFAINKSSSVFKNNIQNYSIRAPLSPKVEKTPKNKLKLELENSPQILEKSNNLNYTEGNTTKKKLSKTKENFKKNLNFHKSQKFANTNRDKSRTITSNSKTYSNNSYMNCKIINDKAKPQIVKNNQDKLDRLKNPKSFLIKKNININGFSERNKFNIMNSDKINDGILTVGDDWIEKNIEENNQTNLEKKTNIFEIDTINTKIQKCKDFGWNINDLQELLKNQYNNILTFQKLNQNQISQLLQIGNNLKNLLIQANEKYRSELKKKQKLNLEMEKKSNKNYIKVSTKKCLNENLINQIQSIRKNELKIYQHIFNKFYFEYDILKFTEGMDVVNLPLEEKLHLLENCVKNIVSYHGSVCRFIPDLNEIEYSQIKTKLKILGINDGTQTHYYKREEPQAKITEEDEDQEDDGLEISETPLKN